MKLKAIRGGNQRGYCFVSKGGAPTSEPIVLQFSSKRVITRIRESHRVPADLIFVDRRLYDSLGLEATTEVDFRPLEAKLPKCNEISLVVRSNRDVDVKDVVKALSDRIEDMEEHLDGLILSIGQKLDLNPLGISITVRDLSPKSDEIAAAIVDWKRVLKVYLEAAMPGMCFNLCFVTDIGAASKKSDISLSASEVEVVGDGVVRRFEAADQLCRSLIETLSTCDGDAYFASVVYSDTTDVYQTFDSDAGTDTAITIIQSRSDGESHSDWLSDQIRKHSNSPSNPSEGLKIGIEKVKALRAISTIPTFLILLSSGAYSLGPNPVSTVKSHLKNTRGIRIVCVGLGTRCEDSLLQAIADAGNGTVALIRKVSDITDIKDYIINMANEEV